MSPVGHEEEFRRLFAREAEDRLERLARDLLNLERSGTDPELVQSVFRDAHSLKGAAAVVGFDHISRVAHVMEEILEQLRSGERLPTPDLIDPLLGAVDGLRLMVPAAVEGHEHESEAARLTQMLRDAARAPATATRGEAAAAAVVEGPERTARRAPEADSLRVPVERLDKLVRLVGEAAAAQLRLGRAIGQELNLDPGRFSEFRDLSRIVNELQERAMRARMVPISTITEPLRRAVRDLSRQLGKEVRWEVRGDDTELDRSVLEQLADPLMHLVRNAIDHGIEPPAERGLAGKETQGTVRLDAAQLGSEVIITVSDDGKGIDVERVREEAGRQGADVAGLTDEAALYLIFRSGLSTTDFVSDISGRGVGLDVVNAALSAIRGRIEIQTDVGAGTELRIAVPITLAVLPCLLVEAAGRRYAIPMHSVVTALQPPAERDAARAEGIPVVWVGERTVPLVSLASALSLNGDGGFRGTAVVLTGLTRTHAFRVDRLLGQREVVIKGLGRLLPRIEVLTGASVEPDGSILLVLDAPGLIDRARRIRRSASAPRAPVEAASRASILVVDDALTVRELQRSILERAGYAVRTAADGVEALAHLAEEPADLVLADIEMPNMDGFALTEQIRGRAALRSVPVLILTSHASEDDRRRGLEVGADGYIVKSAFDARALLTAVERLLGRGR